MGAPDREARLELFLIATEMAAQPINLFIVLLWSQSCLQFFFGGPGLRLAAG